MKIKTSELIGPALDWAVAKASGRFGAWRRDELRPGTSILDIDFDEHGELCEYVPGSRRDPYKPWRPSTDWSQGGPIIEREFISISPGEWDVDATPMVQNICAWSLKAEIHGTEKFYYGPTPLIAAMRCFVASKLGDEFDVPEELSN